MIAREDREAYQATLQRAVRVIVAITVPIAVLLMIGLGPLLTAAFDFGAQGTDLLLWTTRGFLIGLIGQCLLEVAVRSFYARQDAITPLITSGINFVVYIVLSTLLFRAFGAPGISLADSLAFTSQAVLLLVLLNRKLVTNISPGISLPRALLAALAGGVVVYLVLMLPFSASQPLFMGVAALGLGAFAALFPIWKEIRLLLHL
jgi:putative peptidoglycan lipid II flippase